MSSRNKLYSKTQSIEDIEEEQQPEKESIMV
jgi:hypothetical protein